MTENEMVDGVLAEMKKYGEGTTFGDLHHIKIREGEQWAAESWAKSMQYRLGPSFWASSPGGPYLRWFSLVQLAAHRHPDWKEVQGKAGLNAFVCTKSAAIRTRIALVAWFALKQPDIAFALEDEYWHLGEL